MELGTDRKPRNLVYAITAIISLSLLLFPTSSASAVSFASSCSQNDAGDVAIGLAQMAVVASMGPGAGEVTFTVTNMGADASSITEVYFEDTNSRLSMLASLIDADDGIGGDAGVDFSQPAVPEDLPARMDCPDGTGSDPFMVTMGFSADADVPMPPLKGINPGESLGVVFTLMDTFADVVNDLNSGDLRVGIHVTAYESGGSETFVTGSNGVPPSGTPMAVGGEFIGIDTTAVLAAGAQNTAAWMIPVLVAAAGLGIVIARKF